jgi:catechol 2,3-dioxygenase-like lactoylglutathione lyase family enzyme
MNPQPLIAVRDVQATSAWYQAVLGLQSGHGGPEYEQLMSEGRLVLQVHDWEAHEHPHLGDPHRKPCGNGVVLWFQTDEFDQALKRIEVNRATVLEGPMVNPSANHREVWLRDPNGYVVVVAGRYGDLGSSAELGAKRVP